jgi:hypothetical protein
MIGESVHLLALFVCEHEKEGNSMSNELNPENNSETPVPPPPPYSTSPAEYNAGLDVPPVSPLPLEEAIRELPNQYIRVVTKPGTATFAQEQGKAAWNIVWVQILILAILNTIGGFIVLNFTLPATYSSMNVPPESMQALHSLSGIFPLSYIIITPLSIFIVTGIYHLIAKAFGGRGTFLTYCYSYLLYGVPLGIVTLILSLIPFVNYLTFLVGIYEIVLQVFMTMAVHRLSGGRATLAVLILPIIAVVLSCVLVIVLVTVAMHRPY